MAKGKPGADSSSLVTSRMGGQGLIRLAADLFGEMPVFWGRYFTGISTGGTVEYRHRRENRPLRDAGIRVLPIARQTRRVNGSMAGGADCGGAWVARWIRQGGEPLPEWDDANVTPHVALRPILAWQCAAECHGGGGFDCSQTNPSIDPGEFLPGLVPPPATSDFS